MRVKRSFRKCDPKVNCRMLNLFGSGSCVLVVTLMSFGSCVLEMVCQLRLVIHWLNIWWFSWYYSAYYGGSALGNISTAYK